jgi:aminopeptidase N
MRVGFCGRPRATPRAPAAGFSAARVSLGILLAVILVLLLPAILGCGDPFAGSAGIGDPYFPKMGNGGYDALRYQIELDVEPAAGSLKGSTTIEARALQDLDSFNLDFDGLEVDEVSIGGRTSKFERHDGELVVMPARRLAKGATFVVLVTYHGTPQELKDVDDFPVGWRRQDGTIFTLDEPEGAATWFPVNDHPSDKATYVFRITVPQPYVAAANGVLTGVESKGADRTYVWEMRQPLASYLAAVSIDKYVTEEETVRDGLVIRNFFASNLAATAETVFADTREALLFFEDIFGPYPFEAYGAVVPNASTGAAMENQTLSLFGSDVLEGMTDAGEGAVYLSHELAHQWFGDSVTISSWKDVWLNEGFATYASWLWLEHKFGAGALDSQVQQSAQDLAQQKQITLGDPGPRQLFASTVYDRGALALHALRLTVGDDAFFEILRTWAERYEYGNARTADFLALADEVAAKEGARASAASAVLHDWLSGNDQPALPAAQ